MPLSGANNSSAGGSGGGPSTPPWASGYGAAVSGPPADAGGDPNAAPPPSPGVFNVDTTSAGGLAGSVQGAAGAAGDLIGGVGSILGGAVSNIAGFVNGIPGVGAVAQPVEGAVGALAGAAGQVAGAAVGTAGGAAGNIIGSLTAPGGLAQAYAALPADVRAKYDAQIASDPFGADRLREEAVNADFQSKNLDNPDLFAGQFGNAPGETPSVVGLLGGLWGVGQKLVERTIVGGVLSNTNRLQEIMSMDPSQMNEVEASAYQHVVSGQWTSSQAADFLSRFPTGLAHDPGLAALGSIATDPLNDAALVLTGGASLGTRALSMFADMQSMIGAGRAAEAAGDIGAASAAEQAASVARAAGRLGGTRLGTAVTRAAIPISRELLDHPNIIQAARTIRLFVDPLSALGGHTVPGLRAVDAMSQLAPAAVASAHGLGFNEVLHLADDIGGGFKDAVTDGFSTYSGNLADKYLIGQHVKTAIASGMTSRFLSQSPSDVIQAIGRMGLPHDFSLGLKDYAQKVGKFVWTADDNANLADRLSAVYQGVGKTREEWGTYVEGMSKEAKALLHATTYGTATKEFYPLWQDAVNEVRTGAAGLRKAGSLADPIDRLSLLNSGTFTRQDANALLASIKDLGVDDAAALIREAQSQFPTLRQMADLEHGDTASTIKDLIRQLTKRAGGEAGEGASLPSRLSTEEIGRLPEPLQALAEKYQGAFNFGFRPEQQYLWSMERDAQGLWRSAGDPWLELKAPVTGGYRPTIDLPLNAAGQPIAGPGGILAKGAKVVDDLTAAGRQLTGKVSATSLIENGNQNMRNILQNEHGFSAAEASQYVTRLREGTQVYGQTARGLSATNLMKIVEDAIPETAKARGFGVRDVLATTMRGDQGDMRFVGLTNELSGEIKKRLALIGGGTGLDNLEGQVTQNLYQTLKYKMKLAFQVQQRLGGIVFNTMRGNIPALGTAVTDTDREWAQIAKNLSDTGIRHLNNLDQIEFEANAMHGKALDLAAEATQKPAGLWGRLKGAATGGLGGLTNVRANEELNYYRALAGHSGAEFRAAFPDDFAAWKAQAVVDAGKPLTDDEAAATIIAQKLWSGNARVDNVIRDASSYDFSRTIKAVHEHLPEDIGQLQPLDLDHLAKQARLPFTRVVGGVKTIAHTTDAKSLKEALSEEGGLRFSDLTDHMNARGLPVNYQSRVENALNFSYNGFTDSIAKEFNLSGVERKAFEDLFSRAAQARRMTPNDYLSQLFEPRAGGQIKKFAVSPLSTKGTADEAARAAVTMLRGGKNATAQDLMKQVVATFSGHIDPSAQDLLADYFGREKAIQGAYDAGDIARGQALNKAEGIARGGTAESGGAIKGAAPVFDKAAFAEGMSKRILSGAPDANPDIERLYRSLSKFVQDPMQQLLAVRGGSADQLLEDIKRVPTAGEAAHNLTQQLVVSQMMDMLKAKAEDAYTLIYTNQNRRLIDRSLNHPLLGIYPTSFMYGKVLPEMAKFIAVRPFGIRTGSVAYALHDLSASLAAQREYDPSFEAWMQKMGANPLVFLLGYLLPGVPWDINANAPAWLRQVAAQGQAAQAARDKGLPPPNFDIGKVITSQEDNINPITQTEKQGSDITKGITDLQNVFGGGNQPAPVPAPTPPYSGQPVQGTGLHPLLEQQLTNLAGALANE